MTVDTNVFDRFEAYRQSPLVLALCLGLMAAMTNLIPLPMPAGTSLVLGGIFCMMSALTQAPRYVLLTSLLGTLGLALNWQHGWVFLWFPLEAMFVNWMIRQRVNALLADLLFWCLLGGPLVYLMFSLSQQQSTAMMITILVKQLFNGYLYTLLASFWVMLPKTRELLGRGKSELPGLRSYLSQAFGLLCTLCLLGFGLIAESNHTQEHRQSLELSLEKMNSQLIQLLESEYQGLQHAFRTYADLLNLSTAEQQQSLLVSFIKAHPELSEVLLISEQGKISRSLQRAELTRNQASTVARPVAEQHSLQQALANDRLGLSVIANGEHFNTFPLLVVTVPLKQQGPNQAGLFLQGKMSLKRVEKKLQQQLREGSFALVNEQMQVIVTSPDLALTPLSQLSSYRLVSTAMPYQLAGIRLSEQDFFWMAQTSVIGWQLWSLLPVSTELEHIQQRYVNWAGFIIFSSLLAVFLSRRLTRLFTEPLLASLNTSEANENQPFYYWEQQQLHLQLEKNSKALKLYYESLEQQVNVRTHDLRTQNEKLLRVLQSSSDGILELNAQGRVTLVNKTLANWLQRSEKDLVGLTADHLLCPVDGMMTLENCIREARATRTVTQGEGVLRHGDTLLELEFSASPTLHADGKTGVVVMFHNISKYKELQRSIEQARLSAEQSNQAKSDFVANMSHEIKTPLNAISGLIQLLDSNNLTPDQKHCLRQMEHGADLLQGVVNNILDFSRVESGQLTLEQQAFDLEALLSQVELLMSAKAQQRQLKLSCTVLDDVPRGVIGDPRRLTQILMNLVSNGIKFTPAGSVTVTVSSLPDDEGDKANLRFEVTDTGTGIAQEKLESLFLPFTQADTSSSRMHSGTGLGLAISNKLVALMGGQLKASSIPNRGSKFWFELQLPVAHSDQSLLLASSNYLDIPKILFFPKQVLVVEDNEVNLQITKLMLERIGLIPVLAPGGKQALPLLRQHKEIALVLMDLQMPEQDGLATTAQIRLYPEYKHLPIIALTAHATVADKKRCLEAGMQEHLTKPVDMNELVRVLSRFLSYQALPEQEKKIPAPLAKGPGEQIHYFLRHFGLLDKQLGDLIHAQAWFDAQALLNRALQATSRLPDRLLRGAIQSLLKEVEQQNCPEQQLYQLSEQIKQLRELTPNHEPVSP